MRLVGGNNERLEFLPDLQKIGRGSNYAFFEITRIYMYTRYKSTGISFNEVKSNNFFSLYLSSPVERNFQERSKRRGGIKNGVSLIIREKFNQFPSFNWVWWKKILRETKLQRKDWSITLTAWQISGSRFFSYHCYVFIIGSIQLVN